MEHGKYFDTDHFLPKEKIRISDEIVHFVIDFHGYSFSFFLLRERMMKKKSDSKTEEASEYF